MGPRRLLEGVARDRGGDFLLTGGERGRMQSSGKPNNIVEEIPMRHVNSRVAKAVAVAVFAVVGVVVMTAMNTAGEPVTESPLSGSQICATSPEAGFDATQPDFAPAVEVGQQASQGEPVAICRLMPECWSNSDCDSRCGVGLGKCIHSKCPVRLCVCK